MYRIVHKRKLNSSVTQMDIEAPLIAAKAAAGQFIILRVDEGGERIPLTIAGYDAAAGTVRIIFQTVGATTMLLDQKRAGDFIADVAGPLGRPMTTDGIRKVCIVGGGVGCAIALPVAQAFHRLGAHVTSIAGFRSRDMVILEEELAACSDRMILMTDDGSYGRCGNVTLPLKELLKDNKSFDMVIAIGPLIMMKYVVETCRPYGIACTVSMNPIMIDGTGMCGGCRLTLIKSGRRVMRFACVDGPDFDGYEVDFDEAMLRSRMYGSFERHAYDSACNLFKKTV